MGYKLDKGYGENEKEKFVVEYNHNQGLAIVENEYGLFAISTQEQIQNGEIIDISATEEYKSKILSEQIALRKIDLQAEIEALDLKSIRALREGGYKDEATGLSWVDYYAQQVSQLRNELAEL